MASVSIHPSVDKGHKVATTSRKLKSAVPA
jgi:hypothetical protein